MALHRLHPATVNSSQIDGIVGISVSDGVATTRPYQDGMADPFFAAVTSHAPVAEFQSLALVTALGVVGNASVQAAVEWYDAKIGNDGAKAASTAHYKNAMANALTVPVSISARHGGDAVYTFRSIGYGTSAPLVRTASSALSAYTPGGDELFSIGPVTIDGTTINRVQSIDLSFGFQVQPDMADDDVYPSEVKVIGRRPVIRVTVSDPTEIDNILSTNDPLCLASGATVYFKKRACQGSFVADITAAHVKVAIANGIVLPISVAGSPRVAGFEIHPFADSSNDSIVITAGSAIT